MDGCVKTIARGDLSGSDRFDPARWLSGPGTSLPAALLYP